MTEIVRKALGNMKLGKPKPVWLDTVSKLYPPVTFSLPDYIRRTKVGKIPKPPKIVFPEDKYRRKFFAHYRMEQWRPVSMDERMPSSAGSINYPDAVFEEQVKLMEGGYPAEQAYKIAVSNYQATRRKQELAQRVAQEQFLENATVPPSHLIEELLREEKTVLSGDSKSVIDGNK